MQYIGILFMVVCDLCGAEVAKVARHRGTFRCLLQCLTNEGIEIDTHNDMRSLRVKVQSSTFITYLKIMLSYVIQLARQRHILSLMTQPRAPRGTLLILPWPIDKQPRPKGSNCHWSVLWAILIATASTNGHEFLSPGWSIPLIDLSHVFF